MTEKDDLEKLLEDGFRPAMVLRKPSGDEISRLPSIFLRSEVWALPLSHSDGRKCMFYMREKETIEFANKLTEEQRQIIGYDLCVYCSGVGQDIIEGRKLYLDGVIKNLRLLLGWNLSVSEYPHTFEVLFKIEKDDRTALNEDIEAVHKIALALSLHNQLGFVVGSTSQGTRYKGQPFSQRWGLEERIISGLSDLDLDYVNKLMADSEAVAAAKALQRLYSQVFDDTRIIVAWAAIEHFFGQKQSAHLLNSDELDSLNKGVASLENIAPNKLEKLVKILNNPDLVSSKSRNERIALTISERTGMAYDDAYANVRALAKERGGRAHRLSDRTKLSAQCLYFVEDVLWTIIEKRIGKPNPFRVIRQTNNTT